MSEASEVKQKAKLAKAASRLLNSATTTQKNEALNAMADALVDATDDIIEANKRDLERGEAEGTSRALLDRLALNPERIEGIAEGLRQISSLPDPIGETLEEINRPNGLHIVKKRVPIGLIGIIYEARPNVTVDAAGLSLKSGNAVILRGGSAALDSNQRIVEVLHKALEQTDIPKDAIQMIQSADRSSVSEMLTLNGTIDLIIPRGGASLIQMVVKNATVPVIETGAGVCHTYIDEECDPQLAIDIAINAKTQRPSVCNAMETLIVHEGFAKQHLAQLAEQMKSAGVSLKVCQNTISAIPSLQNTVQATHEDFATEYNDYVLNIKTVSHLDDALEHIHTYGTMHSECIVTTNAANAEKFLQEVDAAAVYHNASTRFTDGFEFGFGAEIGISTQKLHARGPMGLIALTSIKYQVHGSGQIK